MVSSTLSFEAFTAAADPAKFPEQLQQGLRPWQVKKLYQPGGGGFGGFGGGPGGPGGPGGRGGRGAGGRGGAGGPPGGVGAGGDLPPPPPVDPNAKYATIDTSGYDPLIGCTIGEVGGVAASMHKCQGRSPIQNFGGTSGARYKLAATVIDRRRTRTKRRSSRASTPRSPACCSTAARIRRPRCATASRRSPRARINAQKAFQGSQNPAATLPDLLAGLTAVRALRAALGSMGLSDRGQYEIDFRLTQKEAQFQEAIILAHGLRIDATADDGLVMGNQPITVTTNVANRGPEDVSVKAVKLSGLRRRRRVPRRPDQEHGGVHCAGPRSRSRPARS